MTTGFRASRTLVKSPPELWAECSDAGSLARHIGEFGEIRITRLEPETSVSWEAEHASGTIEIEASGWGTRVTLTAQTKVDEGVGDSAREVGEPLADAAPAATEPCEEAVTEPPVAVAEPVPEMADRRVSVGESNEEETDAKVEKTVAQSHPALAPDARPAGGRWRRLIARTRVWLGTSGRVALAPAEGPPPAPADALTEEPAPERVREPEPEQASQPEPEEVGEPAPEHASQPELVTPDPGGAFLSADLPNAEGWQPEPAAWPSPEDDAAPPDGADRSPDGADRSPDGADRSTALDPDAVLVAALDSLGQAHHRPYSRA